MSETRILPRQQIEEVDLLLSKLIADTKKWENVELLDDSQCYQIHALAQSMYAAGYNAGIEAEQVRQSGKYFRDQARAQGDRPC